MAVEYYSDQITEQTAAANTPSNTNESGGRVRYAYGAYETPAAGLADAKTIAMVLVPSGARITSVKVTSESMGAASEAVDIGVAGADGSGYYDAAGTLADDIDLISADLDVATENVKEEAIVTRAAVGLTFDKDIYVTGTVETDAWAGEKDFILEVEYVND